MNEEFIQAMRIVLRLAFIGNKGVVPAEQAVTNFNAIDTVTKFVDVAEQCSAEIKKQPIAWEDLPADSSFTAVSFVSVMDETTFGVVCKTCGKDFGAHCGYYCLTPDERKRRSVK